MVLVVKRYPYGSKIDPTLPHEANTLIFEGQFIWIADEYFIHILWNLENTNEKAALPLFDVPNPNLWPRGLTRTSLPEWLILQIETYW